MEPLKLPILEFVLIRCRFPGGLVREDPARDVYFITQSPHREIVWEPQGRESEYYYHMHACKELYGQPLV